MADPALNLDDPTGGSAFPTYGTGALGQAALPVSKGLSKVDVAAQGIFNSQAVMEQMATNDGSFSKNLVNPSNSFVAGPKWSLHSVVNTPASIIGPYGYLDGSKQVGVQDVNQIHYSDSPSFATVASGTVTVSIFRKMEELNWVFLGFEDTPGGGGAEVAAWFDLAAGVAGSFFQSGMTALGSGIEPQGNGWFRLWLMVKNTAGSTVGDMYTGLATADAVFNYDGDGSSGAYMSGAQAEVSVNVVGPYRMQPPSGLGYSQTPYQTLWRYAYDAAVYGEAERKRRFGG